MKAAFVAAVAAVSLATSSVTAQQAIPVRNLTTPVSTDSGVLRSVSSIRHLSDGRVLVDDRARRRISLFDSTLKSMTVIADTAAGAPNKYGTDWFGMIPYLADTTVLVDWGAQILILIEPSGKFGRAMAPPKASDITQFGSVSTGFDPKGRVIYRSSRRPLPGPRPTPEPNKPTITLRPDSAPIMRGDFDARSVDTIIMIKIPLSKSATVSMPGGGFSGAIVFNPLPATDDWALLPDGTVAIVRAQDYHIDWLSPDGKLTSTPKMPFDWKRITLEEKQQLLDSVKAANAARIAALPPPRPAPPGVEVFDEARMPFMTVEPSELPDYYPPVRNGQVRADPDGNVWILPSTSLLSQGNLLAGGAQPTSGLVYDVVNRAGVIFERVQLPVSRTLAGFGPGGIVYLRRVVAPGHTVLERMRIARTP